MPLKLGSNDLNTVQLGSTQLNAVYLGSTELWTASQPNFTILCGVDGADAGFELGQYGSLVSGDWVPDTDSVERLSARTGGGNPVRMTSGLGGRWNSQNNINVQLDSETPFAMAWVGGNSRYEAGDAAAAAYIHANIGNNIEVVVT